MCRSCRLLGMLVIQGSIEHVNTFLLLSWMNTVHGPYETNTHTCTIIEFALHRMYVMCMLEIFTSYGFYLHDLRCWPVCMRHSMPIRLMIFPRHFLSGLRFYMFVLNQSCFWFFFIPICISLTKIQFSRMENFFKFFKKLVSLLNMA